MPRRESLIAFALLLCLPGMATAQDKAKPDRTRYFVGDLFVNELEKDATQRYYELNQTTLSGGVDYSERRELEEVRRIKALDGQRPTALDLHVVKFRQDKVTAADLRIKASEQAPGLWSFECKRTLPEALQQQLEKRWQEPRPKTKAKSRLAALLPKKKVRVGQTWKVSLKAFWSFLGGVKFVKPEDVDPKKSMAIGRLVKVEPVGDAQIAHVEVKGTLLSKGIGKLKLDAAAPVDFVVKVSGPLAGGLPIRATTIMTSEFKYEAKDIKLKSVMVWRTQSVEVK